MIKPDGLRHAWMPPGRLRAFRKRCSRGRQGIRRKAMAPDAAIIFIAAHHGYVANGLPSGYD